MAGNRVEIPKAEVTLEKAPSSLTFSRFRSYWYRSIFFRKNVWTDIWKVFRGANRDPVLFGTRYWSSPNAEEFSVVPVQVRFFEWSPAKSSFVPTYSSPVLSGKFFVPNFFSANFFTLEMASKKKLKWAISYFPRWLRVVDNFERTKTCLRLATPT